MRIGVASDHRGFELKKQILNHYKDMIDFGCNSNESTDYPIPKFDSCDIKNPTRYCKI